MNLGKDELKYVTRNPLGIIALFLVLVYGFSGLVFGYTALNLSPWERIIMVVFLVSFPVLLLRSFVHLVEKHHGKLYAPGDYEDPQGFLQVAQLQLQTETEKEMGVEEEALTVEKEVIDLQQDDAKRASEEPEVTDLAKERLQSDIRLAEKLAFKAIEKEFGVKVLRHVKNAQDDMYDGYFALPGQEVIVDINFTLTTNPQRILESVYSLVSRLMLEKRISPLTVFLAVVTDGLSREERNELRESISKSPLLRNAPLPLMFRLYDFEGLKSGYVD